MFCLKKNCNKIEKQSLPVFTWFHQVPLLQYDFHIYVCRGFYGNSMVVKVTVWLQHGYSMVVMVTIWLLRLQYGC